MTQGNDAARSAIRSGIYSPPADELSEVSRKNGWAILPFLFLGYVVCTLDKGNVGFAALEMNRDLGFSPAVFGLGAALFFVTYTLLEVPSNLLLRRVGARRWLGRILISWGLVSSLTAMTRNVETFYLIRLALGAAEAGWFPAMIFYLGRWFPEQHRARAQMFIFLGSPLSAAIGYPISGFLLSLPPTFGLRGWQWLFLLEGLPSVMLGLAVLLALRDDPAQATWLSAQEKSALDHALKAEHEPQAARSTFRLARELSDPALLVLCAINFLWAAGGVYGILIWLPRIVKDFGNLSTQQIGWISSIPFLMGALALVACAYSSDKHRERKWHTVLPLLAAGLTMAMTAAMRSPVAMICSLTVSMMAVMCFFGSFYAMVSVTLKRTRSGAALAGSIAIVTMVGNIGGFCGPYGIGLFVEAFGDFRYALIATGSCLFVAALILIPCSRRFLGMEARVIAS
jgi:MFS transporter, ACS family, tartrate transporter